MTVFTMTLKRIFGNPLCLIFIMLFPMATFVLLSSQMGSGNSEESRIAGIQFGLVDNDDSEISRLLVNRLATRYHTLTVANDDISATLTESNSVPLVLVIGEGFGADVIAGNTDLETLTSYTISMTDVSAIATLAAQSITRSLMILPLDGGEGDAQVLSAWEQSARLEIAAVPINLNWEGMAQWLSMFGFVAILTAYFVIRTLSDDKLRGMPDRIGALPVSTRSFLLQGSLAAFTMTEIAVILTIAALHMSVGQVPNPLLLFAVMSLYNLFAVSLVLTLTSVVKSLTGVSVAMSMIATLSSMLGGLFWPLEFVPTFMQRVAWFTPGYWFGQGLRTVGEVGGLRELTFGNFGVPVLFLLAFTVVTLLIGGLKRVQRLEVE